MVNAYFLQNGFITVYGVLFTIIVYVMHIKLECD